MQEEVGARINEKVIAKHFNLEPEHSGRTRKSIRPFNVNDVSWTKVAGCQGRHGGPEGRFTST